MKKTLLILLTIVMSFLVIIPSYALGLPSTDGSYIPPPSPDFDSFTASYAIIRAYADVTSVFIDYDAVPGSVEVNGEILDYYPTYMFCTPESIVAPNEDGFGNISNYLSVQTYRHSISYYDLNDFGGTVSYPNEAPIPTFVDDGNRGNSYLYSFPLNNRSMNSAYQYGIVSGEWISGSYIDSIVTGYSIKWSADSAMTVSLVGSLTYGHEGDVIATVDIDRNYNVAAGEIFEFNPQNLLQYEDTINYSYYVFTGNWTCHSDTAGYLVEYKAYDYVNTENVGYVDGYNEYVDQNYSIDLYPIARITSKLTSASQPDLGALDVDIDENGTYSYDVSDYSQINVEVDVPQETIDNPHIFKWLLDSVQDFLSLEVFPDFSIAGILLFVVGFGLILWIVKIFLGG